MEKKRIIIIVAFLFLCLFPRDSLPQENAGTIFFEANDLLDKAIKAEERSYIQACKLYTQARKKLEEIISQHPTSLCARFVQEKKITQQLDDLLNQKKQLAMAELKPGVCVDLLLKMMKSSPTEWTAWKTRLALKYRQEGNNKKSAGILAQVMKAEEKAEDLTIKSMILSTLADVYEKEGETKLSLEVLPRAEETAEALNSISTRVPALVRLASIYRAAGQREKSLEILGKVKEIEKVSQLNDREKCLTLIAEEYLAVGDPQKAAEAAGELETPELKARNLIAILNIWADQGDETNVLKMISVVREAIDSVEVNFRKEELIADVNAVLTRLGSSLWKTGEKDKAQEYVEKALQEAWSMKFVNTMVRALISVAVAKGTFGQHSEAMAVLETFGKKITEKQYQVRAFCELGVAYHMANQPELAHQCLERAMQLGGGISDRDDRATAYGFTCPLHARLGQYDQIMSFFPNLELTSNSMESITKALHVAIEDGEYKHALRLAKKNSLQSFKDYQPVKEIAVYFARSGEFGNAVAAVKLLNWHDDKKRDVLLEVIITTMPFGKKATGNLRKFLAYATRFAVKQSEEFDFPRDLWVSFIALNNTLEENRALMEFSSGEAGEADEDLYDYDNYREPGSGAGKRNPVEVCIGLVGASLISALASLILVALFNPGLEQKVVRCLILGAIIVLANFAGMQVGVMGLLGAGLVTFIATMKILNYGFIGALLFTLGYSLAVASLVQNIQKFLTN